jgi:hypothetical protein
MTLFSLAYIVNTHYFQFKKAKFNTYFSQTNLFLLL